MMLNIPNSNFNNNIINFQIGGNSQIYQKQGWHRAEKSGTWTSQQDATLVIQQPLEKLSSLKEDLKLLISGLPLLAEKQPENSVKIICNNEKIAELKFILGDGFRDIEVIIPKHLVVNNELLEIVFSCQHLNSPKSLGISADTRKLGFFIHEIKIYHYLFNINKNNKEINLQILQQLIRLKNFEEARQILEYITSSNINDLSTLRCYNDLERAIGDYQQASNWSSKITKLFPQDANGWHRLAQDLINLKNFDAARKAINWAYNLAPNALWTLRIFHDLEIAISDHQQAFNWSSKMIALFPENPNSWYRLTKDLINLKQFKQAREAIRKAYDLTSNDLSILRTYNDLERLVGDYNQASYWSSKITELFPQDVNGWHRLAQDFMKIGKIKEARQIINQAYKLSPNDLWTLRIFNDLERILEDWSQALFWSLKIIKLYPLDIDGLCRCSLDYINNSNYDKALEIIEKVNELGGNKEIDKIYSILKLKKFNYDLINKIDSQKEAFYFGYDNDPRVLILNNIEVDPILTTAGHVSRGMIGGVRSDIPDDFGVFQFSGVKEFRKDSFIDVNTMPTIFPSGFQCKPFDTLREAIFGGLWIPHFGHFLTEVISRLWYASVKKNLPIIFSAVNDNCQIPDYAKEIFELLDIELSRVIILPISIHVQKLHIPQCATGVGRFPHDFVELQHMKKNVVSKIDKYTSENQILADEIKKLFFGRKHLLPLATLIGTDFFYTLAKQNKFVLAVHEDLKIIDRLAIIWNAREIIYEEGSFCHLHELLPKNEELIIEMYPRSHRRDCWETNCISYCRDFSWIFSPENVHRIGSLDGSLLNNDNLNLCFGVIRYNDTEINSRLLDINTNIESIHNIYTKHEMIDIDYIENYIHSCGIRKDLRLSNLQSIKSEVNRLRMK